jgi:TrmH family RNA methyltransferase
LDPDHKEQDTPERTRHRRRGASEGLPDGQTVEGTVRPEMDRISVVLVEPQGPRNVGSTARALANFGLRDLRLVGGPPLDHEEALWMAVHGEAVLKGAQQHTSLSAAITDATYVVATTAKRRHRLPALGLKEGAERIVEEAARGHVAILFGRENHGLNAEELALAHATIAVETAPECRALNLAQAVLLIAHEVFRTAETQSTRATSTGGSLLRMEMRDQLYIELRRALEHVGILHAGTEVACLQSLSRLLSLGPMQSRDARLLFTLARRVQNMARAGPLSDSEELEQ